MINNYQEKNMIIATHEDIEYIKNSKYIPTKLGYVHEEVIRRILNDEKYFQIAKKCFDGEIDLFQIGTITYSKIDVSFSYESLAILKSIEMYIKEHEINDNIINRYQILKKCVSFLTFKNNIINKKYNINIENKNYSIDIEKFIEFLELPDIKYELYINHKQIYGIKKEHFLYALCSFFKENEIIYKYELPDKFKKRYEEIENYKKIDFESTNKNYDNNELNKEIIINKELKNAILKNIPSNFNNLEKAIYIYIIMCKTLTYDEEYLVSFKNSIDKHKNIGYINTISPTNNKVVCYEFNLIYAKFLEELGIKYSILYKGNKRSYKDTHTSLIFNYNKYLINVDSVTSVFNGDYFKAKLNQPLIGLLCINKNQNTKNEFNKILEKVYKTIINKEHSKINKDNFNDILNEYRKYTKKTNITLADKLSILIDKVNKANMVGVDTMSYLLSLRKVLFNEIEREKNIKIVIIRNNDLKETNAVIIINKKDYNEEDENIYYLYRPNQLLISVSKEELNERFNDNKLQYIEEKNYIFGIKKNHNK